MKSIITDLFSSILYCYVQIGFFVILVESWFQTRVGWRACPSEQSAEGALGCSVASCIGSLSAVTDRADS